MSESATSNIEAAKMGGHTDAETEANAEASRVTGASLIEVEKMEIGGVKWSVYKYYGKSIGYLFSFGTIILYAVYQV